MSECTHCQGTVDEEGADCAVCNAEYCGNCQEVACVHWNESGELVCDTCDEEGE
jgi:hypothetical protein